MAMGKRKRHAKQASMWVATQDLPRSAAHPFYARLNQILGQQDFDGFVEGLCARFYADDGRPGLPPGRYFRLLLIGYFEGLDAERAIAWRAADSFALREFLGLVLPEAPPDHSTISRPRRLIDLETHEAVFTWMLQRLADAGLVKGKTVGIDATTLEANAALRSIVRRDSGEGYQDFLTKLAQASGIDTPTRADLARIDQKRKKKGSNDDWTHPLDPDAKITKMKDGRTHLAHKAEHSVDLETGTVVAITVQDADKGDTATSIDTLIEAAEQVERVVPEGEIKEVVADKGYHSNQVMVDLEAVGVRSYISEPNRGRRNWADNVEARDAVYRNRRRIRGARGKRLLRQRGERLERPCAHLYETGRMRRVPLRGHDNIRKRLLVHAGALNLGLLMRTLFGVGTPRGLQGRAAALLGLFERAVMQGGFPSYRWRTREDAEAQADALAATLGCTDAAQVLTCLRAKPFGQVLGALPVGTEQFAETGRTHWSPVVDGLVIHEQPRTLYEIGAFSRVPVIIGSNRDDGWTFVNRSFPGEMTQEQYESALATEFGVMQRRFSSRTRRRRTIHRKTLSRRP
jgi:transposase